MGRYAGAIAVMIMVMLVPGPAAAHPAGGGLTVQSIELRTNQPAAQAITVGDGLAEITVTVPSELLFIIVVRRDFDNCPNNGNVFTCSAGAGQLQVGYRGTSQTGAFPDNQKFTVTAQSSGVTAAGTVTIRRSADLAVGDATYTPISAGSAYVLVVIGNHGPDAAEGVRVFVDGVDPRAFLSSNCAWSGGRVMCPIPNVGTTTPGLATITMSRCVFASPITVAVATTTTDSNPGNNSLAMPPKSDAGENCAVVFRNLLPPGGPPGGSGPGTGAGPGNGPGAGSGSSSGASPGATPESAAPTDGATSLAPASALAGAAPSGTAPGVGIAATSSGGVGWAGSAIAVAVLAGAGAGWWLRRRRLTAAPATTPVHANGPAADS